MSKTQRRAEGAARAYTDALEKDQAIAFQEQMRAYSDKVGESGQRGVAGALKAGGAALEDIPVAGPILGGALENIGQIVEWTAPLAGPEVFKDEYAAQDAQSTARIIASLAKLAKVFSSTGDSEEGEEEDLELTDSDMSSDLTMPL